MWLTVPQLGAALGASLGGILSDSIGWRFAYFFPGTFNYLLYSGVSLQSEPKAT